MSTVAVSPGVGAMPMWAITCPVVGSSRVTEWLRWWLTQSDPAPELRKMGPGGPG